MSDKGEIAQKKPVRVWFDGCFDLYHFGHANAVRQAKDLGDVLVVGVHSDEEITKHKGPPVYTEQERYQLARAIKWVDEVVEGVPYKTYLRTLDKYSCDFAAHGDDITTTANGAHSYQEVVDAGRYKEFKRTEGISTTDLITRILNYVKNLQEPKAGGEDDHPRRRSSSVNLMTSTPVDLLLTSKNRNSHAGGDKGVAVNAQPNTLASPPKFGLTNLGIPKMLDTLRIAEFCLEGLREPTSDDIVVYAPGNYDLLHVGHLSFFEKCLELGTYLLVGLHSDESSLYETRHMGCVMNMQERLLTLLSCRYVHNVIIEAPYKVSASLLDHFRVNYVAVGRDTKIVATSDGEDPMSIPKQRGIFRRLDSGSTVTTASVISRILQNRSLYEERNRRKEEREAKMFAPKEKEHSLCAAYT
ncbi:unnamed protein product [Calicophoron daubneyi]|uniref:ethanolamine-phosphate cytidylyltransferase n=1 Tax=Calicophoron daubneyi TaxID=300641 RepID=A0AAV2SYT1_CALDB